MVKKILIPILAAIGVFVIVSLFFFIIIYVFIIKERPLFGDKVAIVEIKGVITDSGDINKKIKEYAERDDVKAIIIRLDTPGGGVGPSQEIYREIMRAKKQKKVIASMGSIATSGGYYIASASHKIVANPGTITGSMGVIMEFANIEELMSKIGLKGYVVKSGEFKDIGSPLRKITKEERKLLQGVTDDLHQQFIDAVAVGRGVDSSKIKHIADGSFFSGAKALEMGLIYELGNLNDAVDIAASLSGIEGKPVVIYPPKKGISLWDIIIEAPLNRALNKLIYMFSVMSISPWKLQQPFYI